MQTIFSYESFYYVTIVISIYYAFFRVKNKNILSKGWVV